MVHWKPTRLRRVVAALFAAFVLGSVTATASAQTDYFWNAPTGSSGTWDTSTTDWSTVAAGPVNYTWTNSGLERANFGNTAGTVTLGTNITAYGINFNTANYIIAGGGNTLTLAGAGGVISAGVAATINAPIAGTVGLTKTGGGTLTINGNLTYTGGTNVTAGTLSLNGANTFTGGTTVTGATLIGAAQATAGATPFSTGPITLNMATMRLNGLALTNTTTTAGDITVGAASAVTTGAASLIVDNTSAGAGFTTSLAAGNLNRGGAGSALVITPVTGSLANAERVTFANGNTLLTNGILPPWVVATATGTNLAADYVTHGANGVAVATYFGGDLTTSNNTSVVNQTTSPAISGPVSAYALRTNVPISLNGNALTLGNGTGQSGLILNSGASITGGNITFGPTEGVVFAQGTTTLGTAGNSITSNGLTITALGATNLTINGTIADGTAPAKLMLTSVTTGSTITLAAANTYSGGTILSANTGSGGNIVLGSDTAFGTGKVTNILVPGGSSPQIQATATRTLANALDLNGGVNFTGTNSITLTGPITIINAGAGGTRTLQNSITTAGATVTYGASPSSSTMTIGNPVANGGDGVGKTVVFSPAANSTMIVNDVLQDPAPGGGVASGSVQFAGSANGVTVLNGQSTYTGPTFLNGSSTIQIGASTSSPFTSGPFGVGTLTPNNSTNNILQPVGGDRTIANPISMVTGFTVSNANGDTSSIMFSGPISMTTAGRTINNSFAATGGTLILGLASNPSTLTLATATGQTLTIANTGNTVINDVIQNAGAISTAITVTGGGSLTLANQNTYTGQTNLNGPGTIIPIVASSNALPNAGFTSGPFGVGTINFNNGTNQHMRPVGNQVLSNAILMTTGFAMDTAVGDTTSSLTFAGPITMTNNRFISNGFTVGQLGGTLIIGAASAPNFLTLPTATNFTLSFAALNGPIIVNDVIQNAAGQTGNVTINPNNGDTNTVTFTAVNTYTGPTTIGGGTNGGGTVAFSTDQPFGTGTLVMNNTAGSGGTPPNLQPLTGDRTLANPVTMTSGFFASNAPGTAFNLTLTGPITVNATVNRTITNNMAGTLTLGSAASPSTITLGVAAGTQLQFQTQNANSLTVVNSLIQDPAPGAPGSILVTSGTVNFTNSNTYSGTTTVSGGKLLINNASSTGSGTGASTVNVTGNGTPGSGGTLGGGNPAGTTGFISGSVNISSATTTTAQGGTLSPGNSVGTLTMTAGVMTWNPQGTYSFEHDASATSPAPIGGTSDLVKGTGTAALDLSSLGSGAGQQFNLFLQPVNLPATLPTSPVTYTIADYSASGSSPAIIPPPSIVGTDLTPFFNVTGGFQGPSTPVVTLVNNNMIQVTFTPVPEPAFVLLACGLAAGGFGLWRRRKI
jgi:fibronectin-binding autotransporter adhesin